MKQIDPYLTVVNKNHNFDQSMITPFKMVPVKDEDGPTYMEEQTHKALGELYEYMLETYGIKISLTSAGRTIERQQQVMDEMIALKGEKAKETTALPGQSEHHLGTALDVIPTSTKSKVVYNALKPFSKKAAQKAIAPIKDDLYTKLHSSLEQFGFILRYSKDKQEITGYPAERWHIRYVGKQHAKAMNQGNLCLEEYNELLKQNQASYE